MISTNKLRSQARAVTEAIATLLPGVLRDDKPADRLLSAYLRERRQFGSRDRRLIGELFYAGFRWWGWTHPAAPADLLRLFEPADAATTHAAITLNLDGLAPWILATAVTERLEPPDVAAIWAEPCGLTATAVTAARQPAEAADRWRTLWPALLKTPPPATLAPAALLPPWATTALPAARPIEEWVGWIQKRPPLWLRLQTERRTQATNELRDAGLDPVVHPTLPDAVRIPTGHNNLYTLPVYQEGRVEIQDLASQLVGRVCAPTPGQRWWDACAGAGGKSLHLALLMGGKGTLMATDLHEFKLEELRRRARRGGFQNIQTRAWDGGPVRSRQATFDGVLLDAPCSGSGTWRRNPAMRWTTTPNDVTELTALQTRLLHHAAGGVKPGGRLVYATCSFLKAENEDILDGFLAAHPEFQPEDFPHPLTGTPTGGRLPVFPWDGNCDAMFIARLRRTVPPATRSKTPTAD